MATVSIFGEPLLELSSDVPGGVLGASKLGVAGDTLNTAIYMSRLGHDVRFVSALGTDPYSDAIVDRLQSEGVSVEFVLRHPDRIAGLYAIRTDSQGERYFTYWRDRSAAREYFRLPGADTGMRSALNCDLFYFSGISLSILPASHRGSLLSMVAESAGSGVRVGFDGNFRPYGWESEEQARLCFEDVARSLAVALPTSEDDDRLWGESSPSVHAERWHRSGTQVVVAKNGPDGAWVLDEGDMTHVPVESVISPTDTTGAGDSFNAGFLAGWLDGASPASAASLGNKLASRVIQHRGAVIPGSEMP